MRDESPCVSAISVKSPEVKLLSRKVQKMQKQCVILRVLALFALFVPALAVHAQSSVSVIKPDIESVLTAKKVEIGADKKEVLTEAKTAKPADVIEYQVTYSNKGKTAVRDLAATLPIPADTEFLRSSARPGTARASLGDGKFYAIPLKRKVKLPNGKEEEIDVPVSEYRALQWSLGELAVGKSVVVSARVRVSDAPVTAPAPATPPTPAAKGGQK